MACLHHMMNKAAKWDLCESNPFDKGDTLLVKEDNKLLRFLSEDEIQRLLAECPKHLKRIVLCALYTGMRRGEILSLQWDQIKNGFIYLTKTKTNESRQIPVNDSLDKMFAGMRKEQPVGCRMVFTFAKGEHTLAGAEPVRERKGPAPLPQELNSVKTAYSSALKRAGIEGATFQTLRHTFCSHMVMRGANLKDVQEIAGHKSMTMTLRYAHLSQEHKKKSVSLLDGLTDSESKKMTSVTKVSQPPNPTLPNTRNPLISLAGQEGFEPPTPGF